MWTVGESDSRFRNANAAHYHCANGPLPQFYQSSLAVTAYLTPSTNPAKFLAIRTFTKEPPMRIKSAEKTIPVFPNSFPYNELLLSGKLIAKTRSWVWKHRGPTLLYTSTSTCIPVAFDYGLDPKAFPRCVIVGVGNLVDVRELNEKERRTLFLQFNPHAGKQDAKVFAKYNYADSEYILPCDYGFFFENIHRFETSVPFKPPKGAVRIFNAPAKLVTKQLEIAGVSI